jgi:lysophospholipase
VLADVGNSGPATLSIREYYQQLVDAVNAKDRAGFNTTITDYWGRGLSYQLFNATDGAPGKYQQIHQVL